MSCPETTYRFRANEDFAEKEDFDKRELSALANSVRIAAYRNLQPRDIRAVNGPLFSFRFRLKEMILGLHDSRTLFIRDVVIPPNSNIELHYYDIVRQKEYIAEVVRHPGLNLDLRSGHYFRNVRSAYIICTRDGGVMVIDGSGNKQYIL